MCIQARHKMKQTLGIEQQFYFSFIACSYLRSKLTKLAWLHRNLRCNKEHSLSLNTIIRNVLHRCWGDFTRRTLTYANLHVVQFIRMFGSTRQLVPAEIWKVRDRVIALNHQVEWPPRSPDLNLLDFFLWGHLKSKVFTSPPADINELQRRIMGQRSIFLDKTEPSSEELWMPC